MVWRKMLQQESEHQWLAITAFFVFVILGAILIKGTSHLPGVDLIDNELGNNHRIIESVYDENGDYLALTYNDGDYKLLSVNDEGANDVTFTNPNYDVSGISDFALLDNNAVLIANGVDELMIYQDDSISIFKTNYSDEVFTVSSIEQSSNEARNLLMITKETNTQQSIRGLNTSGITSASMPNNENVDWEGIQHISADMWLLTGNYRQPATSGEESPAAPNLLPVWSTVLWNGGIIAPMIENLQIGNYGEYHSIIKLNHEKIIIAGTHETIMFDYTNNDISTIDYSSVAGLSDECNRAWLFNGKDSKSVMRFDGDSWSIESLPHQLPLDVETYGFDGISIYLHGVDDNGMPRVMTFDTSAVGSIESGSGFINLSFIILSLVMFALMAVNVIDKFKNQTA